MKKTIIVLLKIMLLIVYSFGFFFLIIVINNEYYSDGDIYMKNIFPGYIDINNILEWMNPKNINNFFR